MARRRDYQAEYHARKTRSLSAGYSGVREYGRARAGLPRNVSPLPKAAKLYAESEPRRQAYGWSKRHSHTLRSRYRPEMSNEQVAAYLDAYDPSWQRGRKSRLKRLQKLKAYLRKYSDVDGTEWLEMYEDK